MKINGEQLELPKEEVIVIPKGNLKIVFKAKMMRDYTEFTDICPEPVLTKQMLPGGKERVTNATRTKHTEAISVWGDRKMSWMITQSLLATDGLEWETVDFQDPDTFNNYKDELVSSGFSEYEIVQIVNICISANGLDVTKIQEATESFLVKAEEEPENL